MQLAGKRVLITGASRGIGRALATAFAGAGATVALVARDGAALESLAAELGGTAHPADLLDREQRERLVHRVEDEAGAVDVLVNNAGLAHEGPLWESTAEQLDHQIQLNLTAPLELCRQAVPRMLRRGGGHLVNVASLAALASVPGMTAYAATKAGIAHGTGALRDELKGLPIAVTTVMVGGVPTDMLATGESYEPFHKSFERLRQIQLVPDTAADDLARAVVRGVEKGSRTVYLPRRAAPFVGLVEAPRKIVHLALTGVKRRA
ncbi:MAG: SDR family NAD(P)-dependent oxidoreductase [Acidimicrobiales bacterium]